MDLVCACNGLLPHVRRGRSRFMDLVCACDALSPLPVQEMAFSCTRRECSRWTSPLPVKEKAISWTWCALAGGFPKRPGTPPEVPGELPKPKHAIIVNNCTTKVMVFGTKSKLYIFRCFPVFDLGPGKLPGGFRKPPDLLSTLPVEEKSIVAFHGSACDGLPTLPVEEKTMSGLPQSQSFVGPKGTLTHSCFTMSKERLPQVSPNASEVPLRGTSAEAATSKGAFSPRHFGSNVPQPRSEHDARQPHSNPPYLLRSNLATA